MQPAVESDWLEALLEVAPTGVCAALNDANLRCAFEAALRTARDAWPDLDLDLRSFAAHVGARLPEHPPLAALLPTLCLEDLFVACACTIGVPGSTAAFEKRHDADVRRGIGSSVDELDEAHQDFLRHVLVSTPDRPARIARYTGRGPLGRWVRVVVRRRLIDRTRSEGSKDTVSWHGNELEAAYGDPELALLRQTTRDAFRDALERGAAALEPRDRNILRYVYVHQLRIREIAGIYRVDASTIKRRLAAIRRDLAGEVRTELRARLGLDERELELQLAELPSVLSLTLDRVLRAEH